MCQNLKFFEINEYESVLQLKILIFTITNKIRVNQLTDRSFINLVKFE